MFSFSTGKPAYPTVYAATGEKKQSKNNSPPSSPRPNQRISVLSQEFLEPAIDGPPSPERIRAYTEQMKRSSIFGNNSRTNTFSSATSSSRSRESTLASTDVSLSRKSSVRSTTSKMPSLRGERPESVQILGSLFSRSARKARKGSIPEGPRSPTDGPVVESSAKDHYYGKKGGHRRKHQISGPYNFQHVTHTRQEHVPDLHRTSQIELVSEFSVIRASQLPSKGELKGIKAEDLHFQNFSSEALGTYTSEEAHLLAPSKSPRHRLRKSSIPPPHLSPPPPRSMAYAKSHDNLRAGPAGPAPPRPPRSPLSPSCPVALPTRTSSRTASILFDKFDPNNPQLPSSPERPSTSACIRKPAPFAILTEVPPSPTWDQQGEGYFTRPVSHTGITPDEEAWPLTASLSGGFGTELADVQEEEDEVVPRRPSRLSTVSAELRMSQSSPALRQKSQDAAEAFDFASQASKLLASIAKEKTPEGQVASDSWESDIDWCYENEVEADCDYQWDRCEEDTETTPPALELRLQTDERTYTGRFRPSLLVAANLEVPELSPMSISNPSPLSSNPRTPNDARVSGAQFLRPSHVRSTSHASSFKESHGFNLSPELLIPADFESQLDHDILYCETFGKDLPSETAVLGHDFRLPGSPIDEGDASTVSYRSSDMSRSSARSSSSTRISRGSQDSLSLLGLGHAQAHRSIGSASSLPDLIPSKLRAGTSQSDLPSSVSVITASSIAEGEETSAPLPIVMAPLPTIASLQHRRNNSLVLEQAMRKGAKHPMSTTLAIDANGFLSPVLEAVPADPSESIIEQAGIHGRKVSAPVLSPSVPHKARSRSATTTTAPRKSYVLFPQVSPQT